MTNEEKAKELRIHYINEGCGDSTDIRCACEDMAEWKDQQFKEYLERKKKKLNEGVKNYLEKKKADTALSYQTQIILLNEIINELFEEIEYDNSDREE